MAIQFPCGKCGALIEVDDQYAGGQCECPACHAQADIPQAGPPATTTPPVPNMSPPTEAGRMLPPTEPGRKGWATASLIFAILAFCMPPLGLIAAICGVIALVKISNNPRVYGGKGLAISGLVLGCIALALIILWALVLSIMLPSLNRARGQARRIACAANLRSISGGCLIYAENNRGIFPSEPSSVDSGSLQEGQTCLVGLNGLKSDDELWGTRDGKPVFMGSGSNPRLFFTLLRGGTRAYLQPKQFICGEAISKAGHSANGALLYMSAGGTTKPVYDFSGSSGDKPLGANCTEMTDFSYSFQVMTDGRDPEDPSEVRGRPLSNSRDDPRKALAADRNPYSNEVQDRSELVAGAYGTGAYVYSPNARTRFGPPPTAYSNLRDLMGRNANSRNHNQEGQNVAYIDGHVKWNTNSLAGADEDCIRMTLNRQETGPRIPLSGTSYGLMRSKNTWVTDALLIP